MTTRPDDPAFARSNPLFRDGECYGSTNNHGGLTKREYFAAMAMQGLISSADTLRLFEERAYHDLLDQANFASRCAVKYADALIEELNRE